VDRIVNLIKKDDIPLVVFQCTSKYPSGSEQVGLNMLGIFRERYQVPVGLSDHSGKIFAALAAVSLRASILEVHVTLSREMFGPDVPVSLTPTELKELVEGVRFIESALAHPVDKDQFAAELGNMRTIFGKSLVSRLDLKSGHTLRRDDLTARKPGTGIPVEQMEKFLGKTLKQDVIAGKFLSFSDFEND
jgi:N,N'-diacetyllegionaminate synthase